MKTEVRKGSRRSTAEIRTLILNAAHQLFEEQGYANTTTNEIAKRAGVGERLIFANFGSKAQLFESALIAPLSKWLGEYIDRWEIHPSGGHEESVRRFVVSFFELARENRKTLLSLIAAIDNRADGLHGPATAIRDEFAAALGRLQEITKIVATDVPGLDPPASTTVVAGAVLAAAIFDDWLSPAAGRPTEDRLVDELTNLLTHGLLHRPPTNG